MKTFKTYINEWKFDGEKSVNDDDTLNDVHVSLYNDPIQYGTKIIFSLINTKELKKVKSDDLYEYENGELSEIIDKDPERFLYNMKIKNGKWCVYFDHYKSKHHIVAMGDMMANMSWYNPEYKGELYSPEDVKFVGNSVAECILFILGRNENWRRDVGRHLDTDDLYFMIEMKMELSDDPGWLMSHFVDPKVSDKEYKEQYSKKCGLGKRSLKDLLKYYQIEI